MKAVVYTQYGSPNVLQLQEVEQPTPGDDELLVKVYAVAINAEAMRYFGEEHPRGKVIITVDPDSRT